MTEENQPERSRVVTWDDPSDAKRQARKMSGAEFFRAMRRGEIPEPPFGKLLGMDLFDVGEGRFTMTLQPQECHYNPMGCVHGGILATLLDSVMSAAVHTSLSAGKGYMTLEIKVNFLKQVFEHTGEIVAEGKVISCGAQVATAEGKVTDVNGTMLATGSTTCLVFEFPAPKPKT
jgi:uncharacterized protein (TIGR00369 family)